MTAEEFKKLKPEYKDIDGNELWDAMTEYMLRQQQAGEILKPIMPIWKTHTLRWLFYRKTSNFVFPNMKSDKYQSDSRCSECKWGVNSRVIWTFTAEDGSRHSKCNCPHCGKDYKGEPNTNFTHKIYKVSKKISSVFWLVLDALHIVRSSHNGRYETFGDESRYVKSMRFDKDWNFVSREMRKRKWWEYILIEKPNHNF